MATPTQQIITVVPDPLWWLKLLAIAVLLSLPLTIGAHYARARRTSLGRTFLIALAALLAGHFIVPVSMNQWGLFAAIAAEIVIFFVGTRYILGTRLLAASVLAIVTTGILLFAISIAAAIQFE